MRGLSIPYRPTQQYLEQYLDGIPWRPQSIEEQQYLEKIKRRFTEQRRKLRKLLNPFNLCPFYVLISFPVVPSVSISVSFTGVNDIGISLRQAIEPTLANAFIAAGIVDLHVPFPLYFLALFSSVGLFFNAKINALLQASNGEILARQEDMLKEIEEKLNILSSKEEKDDTLWKTNLGERKPVTNTQALNLFNLSPLSISVFVPVYETHTAIGILFHDLNYMGISILQSLEPSDNIFTLFRFIHLRAPFALVLLVLFMSLGLFFTYAVNEVEQGAREEIINEVRKSIRQLKKNY